MSLFSGLIGSSEHSRVKSILVVEDDALIAFDNEHALVHAGYTVVAVVDRFPAAVDAMAGNQVDLVVADINLRGAGDGLDVARHAGARGVPVLFSTASCPPEAQSLAWGWLAKPHMARDLIRAIHVVETLIAGNAVAELPAGLTVFSPHG